MGNQKLTFSEELLQLAESGDPQAQNELATCYRKGLGVPTDMEKALEWYRKSAEQGVAEAQYWLGNYYGNVDSNILPKNYEEATKWFALSAEQGYAPAQYNLGCSYCYGQGVPKNLAVAVEWFQKSAEQGLADAQHSLGVCYMQGEGVTRNQKIGQDWLEKAAANGSQIAKKKCKNLTAVDLVSRLLKLALAIWIFTWVLKFEPTGILKFVRWGVLVAEGGFILANGFGALVNLFGILFMYR